MGHTFEGEERKVFRLRGNFTWRSFRSVQDEKLFLDPKPGTSIRLVAYLQSDTAGRGRRSAKEFAMDGNTIGLAAVILIFGIPPAAMYTYYRVRKLRTEERLAAIARDVNVPMEPDLSEAARSRRWGILLAATSVGYVAMMAVIAHAEPEAWKAAAAGFVPLAAGLGFLLDFALIRRDLKSAGQ
jgi:hypothetical protein